MFSTLLHATLVVNLAISAFASDIQDGMERAAKFQRSQLDRMSDFLGPDVNGDTFASSTKEKRQSSGSTITFSNPAAQQFFVDGASLPDGEFH
jgi:carboxypeptidase D